MASSPATCTCPSSLSSKMCAGPLTMFTWRSDLFELSRFADNFLVNNFTWRVNLDCVHCTLTGCGYHNHRCKTKAFSGKPETENLRRPCQVCQEGREVAAGAALSYMLSYKHLKMLNLLHCRAECLFSGVVQSAEIRS